jgi:hypothetical protein
MNSDCNAKQLTDDLMNSDCNAKQLTDDLMNSDSRIQNLEADNYFMRAELQDWQEKSIGQAQLEEKCARLESEFVNLAQAE